MILRLQEKAKANVIIAIKLNTKLPIFDSSAHEGFAPQNYQ